MTMKATLALCVMFLAMLLWLIKRDRNADSQIYLDAFLLGDDGKPSKAALVMYVALGVSSYAVILHSVRGTLTDIMFSGYMAAWVAPTVAKIVTSPSGHAPAPTASIT